MSLLRSKSSVASNRDDREEHPIQQKKTYHSTRDSTQCELSASGVDIDKLPDEILVKILSHFTLEELRDVTQNVCRRWRLVSHDPQLWHHSKFCIDSSYYDNEAVAVLRQMPQLRTLVVRRAVESSVIGAVCENCSSLTTLEFDPSQEMSLPLLEKLTKNCESIESLCIPHQLLHDDRAAQAWARLRRLRSLEVSAHSAVPTPVYLQPLADGCPQLARLKLSEKVDISWNTLRYFISTKCETLTHLTLPWRTTDKRCVVPLLEACTSLTYLQLEHFLWLDHEGAAEAFTVLGRLSNLRSLILNELLRCPARAPALAFESGGMSRLQVLEITCCFVESSVVVLVCRQCPQLRELYLKCCISLTDDSLKELYRLSSLHTLDLTQCLNLGGDAIRYVADLPNLRKLFLEELSAKKLRPGLKSILNMTFLEVLNLKNMHDARYFHFDRIPEKLLNLRVLDARGIDMDYRVLDRLRKEMPRLQVKYER